MGEAGRGDGYMVRFRDGRYLGFAEGVLSAVDDSTYAVMLTRREAQLEADGFEGASVVRWGDEEPFEVDLHGRVDARGIRYIGKAVRTKAGSYVCLADVEGCLCRVEVTLSFGEQVRDG